MNRVSRSILGLVLALGVAGCGGSGGGSLPQPGTPEYEAYASSFFIGLVGLKVDAPSNALSALTTATTTVPGEPAGWANLGLLSLRQSRFPEAEVAIKKAVELAPESAAVVSLAGLLEVRRGQLDAAVPYLRKALALSPKDLKARYALVQALDKRPEAEAQAECRKLIDEIASLAPANLIALVERARLAAKAKDAAGFQAALKSLRANTAGWTAESIEVLDGLEKGPATPEAATEILFLQQTLQVVPAYQQSILQVRTPDSVVGEPLETFVKMAPPARTPGARDTALTFTLQAPGAACGVAVPVWPEAPGNPAVVTADAARVMAPEAPFPGAGQAPSRAGIATADLDGDFHTDLVLAGAGGLSVLLGQPKPGWKPAGTYPGAFHGAWPMDVELDGDLDVVVGAVSGATAVYQNAGDGKLQVVPNHAFAAVASARDVATGDLDGEGTPDVAFVDAAGKVSVFLNQRAGVFALAKWEAAGAAAAVTIGDVDADGRLDLVVAFADGALKRFTRSGDSWAESTLGQGPAQAAGLALADVDNNGALDLVVTGAAGTSLFLSDGKDLAKVAGPAEFFAQFVADVNGDGRLDLIGRNKAGAAVTAVNAGKLAHHFQVLRFRGSKAATGDKRINPFGVSGIVELRSGLVVQTAVIAGPVVHFGLGGHTSAEAVRVVWPNGTLDGEFDLKADTIVTAEQRLKGSCPWVFTHDGRDFTFVTDFLWRSPLGLKINAQDTAGVSQTEDRVKIRGDQLVARNGAYDVRITAELWETHFFDHVSLMIVDHPASCEVFVDERFSPKAPPALDVRAVTAPRQLNPVRDDTGRDVTLEVAARDNNYVDVGRGRWQGVTRDHWVQLPPPVAGDRWLVASGWIHPTDSSINVAIGQQKDVQPRGLSLEARDADGSWKVLEADLGFPAGKNKTVLIPVDRAAGRALRLRTNLEIFWDQLRYAGESTAKLAVTRVPASKADLRYRGYSRVRSVSPSAPELPDYQELAGTLPRWRDLEGFHTRFGDVRELLERVDDRYVIMNAGDEMALSFAAPALPQTGFVRDFVLVGDGWEKDGDFNTAFSRTVLPLPSHDSPAYDRAPGALTADPVYRKHASDWKSFHTRWVSPAWYSQGLR